MLFVNLLKITTFLFWSIHNFFHIQKSCLILSVWIAGQLETHRPQNVHEKQTTSLFFGSLRNWSNKKSVSLHFIKGLMSSFTGSRTWVLNKQLAKFMNPWYSCLTGVLKTISSYRLSRNIYTWKICVWNSCQYVHLLCHLTSF